MASRLSGRRYEYSDMDASSLLFWIWFKYDEHFWEDFNVIPLEEELSRIIEKVALKIEKIDHQEE